MLPFLPCARRVRFRPAFVSRLSPLPCFILPLSGGRRRISGCRIGGCIVLFRFISMRNSKKRRNCGIRASIRPEIGAESPRLCRFRPSRIYITCIYKIIIINKIRNFNFYIIGRCSLPAPLKWILLLLRSVPDLRFVIFFKNS